MVNSTVSRVGSRFGPYQLRRLLGRGGMGEVYEAEDTRKHRVVALKLISPQFSTDLTFRTRMRREADTAGRLTEPHIVPIHDYGDIDGQSYVEMRLIDGVSLAVGSDGAVYVADFNNRVVKLTAGSTSQTVLPFTGLNYPEGVAVDGQGSVYVADRGNDRVLMLAAGSTTSTVLPFTDVAVPWGIAVDNAGDVFVTEHDGNQVLKLPTGSNTPTVLPVTELNNPLGVAVDNAGNIYVADRGNDRAVKLSP
jgi:DNA-binding beta-propeller fold protein YncE